MPGAKRMNITMLRDIEPVVEVSQKTGIPIEVCTFIGSSPIRDPARFGGI